MRRLLAVFTLLALGACAPAAERLTLTPSSYPALPGWTQDDSAHALAAFRLSCDAKRKLSPDATIGKGPLSAGNSLWQPACDAAMLVPEREAQRFFETHFTPFTASGNKGVEGMITGYYEPELAGSLTRHGPYQTPVYALPDDIVQGTPYYSRAEIDAGALAGRGLEIAWVRDPVALFFLHIQGSGIIRLENGERLRIGYAGKNGHGYVALGKVMIDRELLAKEEVSMFTIKSWLYDHPEESQALMEENPSYVFFRPLTESGPLGAEGTVLTPGRSIAIDPRFVPYGLPVYLDTTLPDGMNSPLTRLMIAQDTGGAIKGAVRADVFFGYGEMAERFAGEMKQPGRCTFLVPNTIVPLLEP